MFCKVRQVTPTIDTAISGELRIRILPASEKHAPALRTAWDLVARENRFLALTEGPSEQEVLDFLMHNIAAGNPHLVVLANDSLVGWCDVVRLSRPTMKHRGTLSVGLLPAWRGRGIGRQMIEQCIRLAWNREFKRLELVVRSDNISAISLYQRLGFKTEGIRNKAFVLDGCYHDLIDMALLHPSLDFSGNL